MKKKIISKKTKKAVKKLVGKKLTVQEQILMELKRISNDVRTSTHLTAEIFRFLREHQDRFGGNHYNFPRFPDGRPRQ